MQDTNKPKRGTESFLKHLYCVLTQDKVQCLQWDTNDDCQFIWHGHNEGLLEYIKTKRGRFNVSKEDIFRKKLGELGFLVCEQRVDCHQGSKCAVYKHRSGSAFFRGMCIPHTRSETLTEDDSEPQRKRRRSDASPTVSPTLPSTPANTIQASDGVEEMRLDPPQDESRLAVVISTEPSAELGTAMDSSSDHVNVDDQANRLSFSELLQIPLTPGVSEALLAWCLPFN
ncbi:hypothetical protein Poli38472_001307 [Pythium oligandrum]|uniref:HSF-type DNA-binding domain-containing protein n=1 Tax=Pythium oligandrum TaxID=41045 RepID=A0A8K1FN96_PYTOL|nr:hypothetical protein Poli38472_001307 [Pythium oligandrum]|eukprot:TMW69151.1 hypothetical protein Poli38472_001307 [Pythium oligandrum]